MAARRRRSPLTATRLESRDNPGAGRFNAGVFDFCVSLRFDATDAQIAQIKTAFDNASQIILDATDGQHRFGTITIVNNSRGGEAAEFWVHPTAGRANASAAGYGVRGQHSNLFFLSNFQARAGEGADGDAYTLAHEFAHQAYGILDEYSGPAGNAECWGPPAVNGPNLSYSLMDNYFTTGGRNSSPRGAYTLNEFSVPGNHDPDGDTWQTARNKKSDWEQIAASKYPATMPTGLPVDAPPARQAVTFQTATGLLSSVLVLDKSGSMSGDRIVQARRGGVTYLGFTQNGDNLGVVSFDDSVADLIDLMPVTQANRAQYKTAINAIQPTGSTNITGGLRNALDQINAHMDMGMGGCNDVIVLLTDGDHNSGPAPDTIIPDLQKAGVAVFAVGVGSGISASGQATLVNLATKTGGRYFAISSNADQARFLLRLNQEAQGNGLLQRSAQSNLTNNAPSVDSTVRVEPNAGAVSFVATRQNDADVVNFTLRSPSGRVITPSSTDPDVSIITDTGLVSVRVTNPEAGNWTMTGAAASAAPGVQLFAYGSATGTQVQVQADNGGVAYPAPLVIRATPQYQGFNITGGTVTAVVTRPDGSTANLTLADDGGVSGSGDTIPGDGVYSGRFTEFKGNGPYTVDVTVDAVNATIVSDDGVLFPSDPSSPIAVPAFTRIGTVTANVTGVPATVTPVDLGVTLAGPTGAVTGGAVQTYTVTVTNTAATAASGVVATVRLPGGLAFGSTTASTGSANNASGVVTYTVGNLAAGATATLTLTATPAADGLYRVGVDVVSSAVDPNLTNNQAAVPKDNSLPTLAPITDRAASTGVALDVPITVGDGETALDNLVVTAVAADGTVLPASGVQVVGTGATRTLRLTAAKAGTTVVRVTVTDGGGLTASQTFTLTATGVTPPVVKPAGSKQFALGGTGSGNTLRFFNPDRTVRYEVNPFPGFTGQVRTATADFNGDGIADVVVGTGPGTATKVRVLDGATQAELFSIDPFEASFKGGVYVAAGDLTGDGTPELVITPDEGGGPRVRVFTGRGFGAIADFFGIDDTNFRGGARASVGDMNGDGTGDLIVAAGFGGGPRVAIFDGKVLANNAFTRRMTADGQDFFLFEQTLRNGAFVSAGDVTGDGKADLVGGGGPGGGPRVYVLDGASLLSGTTKAVADYFAGDSADRSGVRVAVKDFDADGRGDVLAGIGSGSRAVAYSGPALAAKPGGPDELFALDPFPGSNAGVYVG